MSPRLWPTNPGSRTHKKLTLAQMDERKRLAEELLLTPEIRLQNQRLRRQCKAGSQIGASRVAMFILRCWPLLLTAACVAVIGYLCIPRSSPVAKVCFSSDVSRNAGPVRLYSPIRPRAVGNPSKGYHRSRNVNEYEHVYLSFRLNVLMRCVQTAADMVVAQPQVHVTVPAPASDLPHLPVPDISSVLPSNDLLSAFKQATALFQVANSSDSHTVAVSATVLGPSTVSIQPQARKAPSQESRRGGMLPHPPSLSPATNTGSVANKRSAATQTTIWGATLTPSSTSNSVERLAAALASASTVVLDTASFAKMWVLTVGCSLLLCVTMLDVRSLLSLRQSYASRAAPDIPRGHTGGLRSEYTGASTPCLTPYTSASPQGSPAPHVRLIEICYRTSNMHLIMYTEP